MSELEQTLTKAAELIGTVPYDEAVNIFRKRFLLVAFKRNRGNQCKMAAELGVHRNTVRRLMTESGIDLDEMRTQRYLRSA